MNMAAANRKSRGLRIPYMDTKRNVISADPAAGQGYWIIRSANFGLANEAIVDL
jgi:hypothetical protein